MVGEKYEQFIDYIINDCLINLEVPNKIKFKSANLRRIGYSLL